MARAAGKGGIMADQSNSPRGSDAEPVLSTMLSESPELLAIVEQFVRGLPERLDAIQEALRQQSYDRIERLAAQLKSAGGSHGFAELTEQARWLEQAAHSQAMAELTGRIEEMTVLVNRIQAGLGDAD